MPNPLNRTLPERSDPLRAEHVPIDGHEIEVELNMPSEICEIICIFNKRMRAVSDIPN